VCPDPKEDDYIFLSIVGGRPDRSKPISVSYINRIIKGLARKAEIARPINTYLLRHTRLTEIRKLGIQGVEFNKFAGHTPGSKQEAVYVHLDNEDMKRTVIEKVYKIDEEELMTRKYEERIAALERQLRSVLSHLKETGVGLSAVKQFFSTLGKTVKTF
jgi:hypothetical protein